MTVYSSLGIVRKMQKNPIMLRLGSMKWTFLAGEWQAGDWVVCAVLPNTLERILVEIGPGLLGYIPDIEKKNVEVDIVLEGTWLPCFYREPTWFPAVHNQVVRYWMSSSAYIPATEHLRRKSRKGRITSTLYSRFRKSPCIIISPLLTCTI